MLNLMNVRSMLSELFHADEWTNGRTDIHHIANSRFLQFCERA
jgi:hypothetical protein